MTPLPRRKSRPDRADQILRPPCGRGCEANDPQPSEPQIERRAYRNRTPNRRRSKAANPANRNPTRSDDLCAQRLIRRRPHVVLGKLGGREAGGPAAWTLPPPFKTISSLGCALARGG